MNQASMKPKAVMIQPKVNNAQKIALAPIFNAIAIQNEIALNMAPLFKEQSLLRQFFQKHSDELQSLTKSVNHALGSYRQAFEVFDDLQKQIQKFQKEREQVMASVTQIMAAWNSFSLPAELIIARPVILRTREAALREDDLIETITNKVIEKVEKRAREGAMKLLSYTSTVPVPSGARWESITFAFIDDSNAEIRHGRKFIGRFNREELKFVKTNTREKQPNNAWLFLLVLSAFQNVKESKPTIDALLESERFKDVERNALHATKSALSGHLSKIFGIDDEPFYRYSEYGYYYPKFSLVPPIGLRNDDAFIARKKKGFSDDPQLEEAPY